MRSLRRHRRPQVLRSQESGVFLFVPASVASLARFALSVARRDGRIPPSYDLSAFLIDAGWERAVVLAAELAMGCNPASYLLDPAPSPQPGEGALRHLPMFILQC